jgi:hypothetical protein
MKQSERPFESELDEYDVYEGEQPPKGVYRCRLKMLRLKQNKNGEPMVNGLLVISEPKKSPKAQYNGYSFWFNINVTKVGAPWVNNFLSVLVPEEKVAGLRKLFWDEKVMLDKEDPPNIVSIGQVKFALDDRPIYVKANTKMKRATADYDESLDVLRFLRDSTDTSKADEPDDEDVDEDEGYQEDPGSDDEGEADEEFDERQEELEDLETAELKKILKGHGFKIAQYKGKSDEDLINMILDHEFPEEEDEEGEEDETEDQTDEEDYEEEEPDPEPPAKPARGRRAGKAAAEKPAAATPASGTRRRRAKGEPPF